MSETRPSSTPLIDGSQTSIFQEVASIDQRGRLHFPPRWTNRIDWLRRCSSEATEVLIVLREPGMVSLLSWQANAEQILKRYEAIAGDDQDTEKENLLRLIVDRYGKLIVTPERRPHLGDPAILHLGLSPERGLKRPIYAAIFADRIDLMSPSYRDTKLNDGNSRLDDLP